MEAVGKTKDIREAVEAELTFDPVVDEANITVQNMNGEVALNGTVPSYPQYLEAAAAAQRVAGVTNVHNHLDRYALIPDDSDVQVGVKGNVITLTGHVSTWAEHDAAVDAAWMANGVIDVRDELAITG
jgi:osmotically-inducible protein OsmY